MTKSEHFWVSLIIWAAWGLLAMFPALIADASIQLNLVPSECSAPCTFTAVVWTAPEIKPNEQVCLAIDNGKFYQKSCWPHLGLKWLDVKVRDIPAGTYQVSVFTLDFEDHQELVVH